MYRPAIVALAVIIGIGCVPRDRLNAACHWGDDPAGKLDPTNPTHRDHLTLDVIVAEELAVRYADATTPPPRGAARDKCLAQLFPEISRAHGIPLAEVEAARGRREGMWDTGVLGLFAAAYAWLSLVAINRIRRSFSGSRRATVTALVVVAMPLAATGTFTGELWALLAEGMRVSNLGHLSGFRGNRIPWRHNRAEIFAGAIALFWLIAIVRSRLGSQGDDPALSQSTC